MSVFDIKPTTIVGIKRLASNISKREGVAHSVGLDQAAVCAGYANYKNALRTLNSSAIVAPSPHFSIFISVFWRNPGTKERGTEIIEVSLPKTLDRIIDARRYKYVRGLWNFRRVADDHLLCQAGIERRDIALAEACRAARALQFMAATGLRPSSRRTPPGYYGQNKIPGLDHGSGWYHPGTKQQVFVDEPYAAAVVGLQDDRAAWAERNGWEITKPDWLGMYYPDGGCELYLLSNLKNGHPAASVVSGLEDIGAPLVPESCNRVLVPEGEQFCSPGEILAANLGALKPSETGKTKGSANTVGYRMILASGRRPKAKMAVGKHEEVASLLKDVLSATFQRPGVYKRVGLVRSELDDWVQIEHDREALPNDVFFNLYYHHRREVPEDEYGAAGKAVHIARLQRARDILTSEYPDCRPVRNMSDKLALAIKSLQAWS
tara:strand:+ start:19747 stop:21051 length:1305 start_codon:yes stop_codon:yes gene_type:complete